MAEKTEKATPKKLRDARKKGQVAKSQDFPSAFTFIVSIATTIISAGYLFEVLASYIISMFKLSGTNIDLQNRAAGHFFSGDPSHFQYKHADLGADSVYWTSDQLSHCRARVLCRGDEARYQAAKSRNEHQKSL